MSGNKEKATKKATKKICQIEFWTKKRMKMFLGQRVQQTSDQSKEV